MRVILEGTGDELAGLASYLAQPPEVKKAIVRLCQHMDSTTAEFVQDFSKLPPDKLAMVKGIVIGLQLCGNGADKQPDVRTA